MGGSEDESESWDFDVSCGSHYAGYMAGTTKDDFTNMEGTNGIDMWRTLWI